MPGGSETERLATLELRSPKTAKPKSSLETALLRFLRTWRLSLAGLLPLSGRRPLPRSGLGL